MLKGYDLTVNALKWIEEYLSLRCTEKIEIEIDERTFKLKTSRNIVKIHKCGVGDVELKKFVTVLKNKNEIPIFGFQQKKTSVCQSEKKLDIEIDVITFLFFTVNRVEEYFIDSRDVHDRFSYKSSIAYEYGFLNLPVVDYIIIFLCEKLNINKNKVIEKENVYITHDVDRPYMYFFPKIWSFPRFLISKVIRLDLKNLVNLIKFKFGIGKDPFDNFDYLMDVSDKKGLKSHFYFIPDNSSKRWDSDYKLNTKKMKFLIKKIDQRQHYIGCHFSYNSKNFDGKIKKEFNLMKNFCEDNDIKNFVKESRMHYLRWDTWLTAKHLEMAGVKKDLTFGYADILSFRSGTCHKFMPFCIKSDKKINVELIPLSIMEGTVFGYMNVNDEDEILNIMKNQIDIIKSVDGIVNILWHNSDICELWQKRIYERLIDYVM